MLLKVRLAEAETRSGQFFRAEETLGTALRTNPNNASALVALGRLYRKEYRYPQAIEISNKLKKTAPRDVQARLFAASLDLDRMDYSAAQRAYKKLLEKDPRQIEALLGLAQIAYSEDHLNEVGRYVDLCLEIDPNYSRAWLLKGQIHRDRQENAEYAAAIRKAVASDPFDDAARTAFANAPNNIDSKIYTTRIDATPTANQRIFGRLTMTQRDSTNALEFLPGDGDSVSYKDRSYSLAGGDTWIINSKLINVLTLGLTKSDVVFDTVSIPTGANRFSGGRSAHHSLIRVIPTGLFTSRFSATIFRGIRVTIRSGSAASLSPYNRTPSSLTIFGSCLWVSAEG